VSTTDLPGGQIHDKRNWVGRREDGPVLETGADAPGCGIGFLSPRSGRKATQNRRFSAETNQWFLNN